MNVWRRRKFLGFAAVGAVVSRFLPRSLAEEPGFLVRNRRPLDAETPASAFSTYLTPNRLFFIRSHFGPPAEGLAKWEVAVSGRAGTLRLGLDELERSELVTLPAVLQCSGNGRAYYEPKVPGVAWDRGAVGNAAWSGVRLRDVLERAGIGANHKHVHFLGADGPPNPKTPAFLRSLPIDRATDPSTILAWKMNGEPLPMLHGGPVRLIVPGWSGNHWIKWVRSVGLAEDEAPGFYQRTGYRIPKSPVPPGQNPRPEDLVPVTTLNVKSLFAAPTAGSRSKAGPQEARGVAWTGLGRVAKVEVSIDGGPWRDAELVGPDHEGAWRLWEYSWDARPGAYRLKVRATDSRGEVQPEKTAWNKSGYLWNGLDETSCEVTA